MEMIRHLLFCIQMVGEHDLSEIEQEIHEIQKLTEMKFLVIAIKVNSWNHDLSPWNASAVFGSEGFGDGAEYTTKSKFYSYAQTPNKTYCIGGYSMAGLFALWAACKTNRFAAIASASPSIWFPGFLNYMKQQKIQSNCIYLSLGNKEEKTRNPMMKQVGDCIREAYAWLNEEGYNAHWNGIKVVILKNHM